MSGPAGPAPIRHVAASPAALVLVCRKCSKRLGGGFGPDGDERLAKVLQRLAGAVGKGAKKPRRAPAAVLEVGCLGLCPKKGVVVLRGDRPGDWLVVPGGTPAEAVAAQCGLPAIEARPGEP